MFDYVIEFHNGETIKIKGTELNIAELFEVGYTGLRDRKGHVTYINARYIKRIDEKERVDRDA
ncbi:hypothetical protein [Sporosarcina jiandibaonis]|uniref:hypothetical protein n=1 Tax=Sporosarcina jiandibaonis TaxID=2715535 RepID=UPI0015567813|nr:hypothetical protein [Sporosarcina jiandibaonis]